MNITESPNNHLYDPMDERLISLFFEYVLLMLFVWGIVIQAARITGLPLLTAGHIAAFCMCSSSLVWWKYVDKKFIVNRHGVMSVLVLLLFCLVIGYLRSKIEIIGTDGYHYLSRAAFLIENPDYPLSFDMPGQFPDKSPIVYGIWIPYTFEYMLGYISVLTGYPLSWISITALPTAIASLIPLPVYAVFRKFGYSIELSLCCTILAVLMLIGDAYNLTTIGGTSILRTYENKGVLMGIGFPIFWYFLFHFQTLKRVTIYHYLRIFWVVSAFCFLTANAIYLLPVSALLFFVSMMASEYIINRAAKFSKKQIVLLMLSILLAPCINWFFMQIHDLNIYAYSLLVHDIFGIKDNDLTAIYQKVFRKMDWMLLFGLSWLTLIALIKGIKNRDTLLTGISIWLFVYIFFVLNPICFMIVRHFSDMYKVYFRFFYVVPIFYFPFFLFQTLNYFHQIGRVLILCAISLLISIFFITHSPLAKNYIERIEKKKIIEDMDIDNHMQKFLNPGDCILSTRDVATKMIFWLPSYNQLVIHGYYLLGRAKNEEEFTKYLDLVKAQHYMQFNDSPYKNEFIRAIENYYPKAIISEKITNNNLLPVLENMGYKNIVVKSKYLFFVKENVEYESKIIDMNFNAF